MKELISLLHKSNHYEAVRIYYIAAADYALANLPINDSVDFKRRNLAEFSQVEFF